MPPPLAGLSSRDRENGWLYMLSNSAAWPPEKFLISRSLDRTIWDINKILHTSTALRGWEIHWEEKRTKLQGRSSLMKYLLTWDLKYKWPRLESQVFCSLYVASERTNLSKARLPYLWKVDHWCRHQRTANGDWVRWLYEVLLQYLLLGDIWAIFVKMCHCFTLSS